MNNNNNNNRANWVVAILAFVKLYTFLNFLLIEFASSSLRKDKNIFKKDNKIST